MFVHRFSSAIPLLLLLFACDEPSGVPDDSGDAGGKLDDAMERGEVARRIQPIDTAFMIPFPDIQPFHFSWWTELGGVPGVATDANRTKLDGCLRSFDPIDDESQCDPDAECYPLDDGRFCTGSCPEGTELRERRCVTDPEQHQNLHIRAADPTFGPLLDPDQFAVLEASGFNSSTMAFLGDDVYQRLYVVGVRFDPCATQAFHASGEPSESCSPQFRLVLQRDGFLGGIPDAAIHLVYAVDDPVAAVDRLLALKSTCETALGEPTDAFPVGPHPCLSLASPEDSRPGGSFPFLDPSGSGPMQRVEVARATMRELRDMIQSLARPEVLSAVATMVANGRDLSQTAWRWRAFEVEQGRIVPVPTSANHPGCGADEACVEDAMTFLRVEGRVAPTPTTRFALPDGESLGARWLAGLADGRYDSHDDVRQGLLGAYVAENPRRSAFPQPAAFAGQTDGNDCASCHIQGGIIKHAIATQGHVFDASMRDAIAQVRYEPPPGLNCQFHPGASRNRDTQPNPNGTAVSSVVINMGFEVGNIELNPRTTNEACDVAHFINETILEPPDTCQIDVEVRLSEATRPGQDLELYGTFGAPERIEGLPFGRWTNLQHVRDGEIWRATIEVPRDEEALAKAIMRDGEQSRCFRWERGSAHRFTCAEPSVVLDVEGFEACMPAMGGDGRR